MGRAAIKSVLAFDVVKAQPPTFANTGTSAKGNLGNLVMIAEHNELDIIDVKVG